MGAAWQCDYQQQDSHSKELHQQSCVIYSDGTKCFFLPLRNSCCSDSFPRIFISRAQMNQISTPFNTSVLIHISYPQRRRLYSSVHALYARSSSICGFYKDPLPLRRGVSICSLAWKIRDERLPLLGSVLCVYIYLYKILSTVRGASCYSGGLRGVKKYLPFLTIGFNQKLLFCSQWSQQWGITLSDGDTVTGLAISSLMERQDGAMVTQTLGELYSASFFAGSLGEDHIFGLPWGLQGSPMKRMKVSPKPKVS